MRGTKVQGRHFGIEIYVIYILHAIFYVTYITCNIIYYYIQAIYTHLYDKNISYSYTIEESSRLDGV